MAANRWPCRPERLSDLVPADLLAILRAGAISAAGRPIAIIDPVSEERIDSVDQWHMPEPLCRCVRGECPEGVTLSALASSNCARFDLFAARAIASHASSAPNGRPTAILLRCWLGLLEVAFVISVAGHVAVLLGGQFRPPNGVPHVAAALDCLRSGTARSDVISHEMAVSLGLTSCPEDLWSSIGPLSADDKRHLLSHAEGLTPMEPVHLEAMSALAARVQSMCQGFYEQRLAAIEGQVLRGVVQALDEAGVSADDHVWAKVQEALGALQEGLGARYVAFFSAASEDETFLELRAVAGDLATHGRPPHFNWRKAGLRTGSDQDAHEQTLDWQELDLDQLKVRQLISRGLRGGDARSFRDAIAALPFRLANGLMGLTVIGSLAEMGDLQDHARFIRHASDTFAAGVLTQQLAALLQQRRTEWENVSKLTGHRVRSSLQNLGSQLETIEAYLQGRPGFTQRKYSVARIDLKKAFEDLKEVSYAAEARVPGSIDVRVAARARIRLEDVLWRAIDNQQELARAFGVRLSVEDIGSLGEVYGNATLLTNVFVNLINNAIKYSLTASPGRERSVRIKPSHPPSRGMELVEVVNFGLGIKREFIHSIFDWGVRYHTTSPTFRETYGVGIGLWEAKHIVEGHGGRVLVESRHHSGAVIDDRNIGQCVTVFTVVLPSADRAEEE